MKGFNWKLIVGVLILSLGLFLFVRCQQNPPEDPTPPPPEEEPGGQEEPGQEEPGEDPPSEEPGISVGNQAPDFTLENHQNQRISLASYQGKPVVLTFWVSWSEASVQQLDVLENISVLLGDQVSFLGIHGSAFDTLSMEDAIGLINEENYPYEVLIDPESTAQQLYYVGNFPTTYVLDENGSVVKTYTSLTEEDQLLKDLESILENN